MSGSGDDLDETGAGYVELSEGEVSDGVRNDVSKHITTVHRNSKSPEAANSSSNDKVTAKSSS